MLLEHLKQLLETDCTLERQCALLRLTLDAPLKGEELFQAAEYLYRLGGIKMMPHLALDIVGTGGDGLGLFNISTTSSFVIAAAGIPVLKHGNTGVSSRSGSVDCLRALHIKLPETLPQALMQFERVGLSFLFAPQFYPFLAKIKAARQALAMQGERSIFNILGPLLNPFRPTHQLIGAASPVLIQPMAEALHLLGRNAFVFSCAGSDEIIPGENMHIVKVNSQGIQNFAFTQRPPAIALKDLTGGLPDENAEILLNIFTNRLAGPKREAVLINSAFGLMLYAHMEFDEAYQRVKSVVEQGEVLQKLKELQQ